MPGYAVIVKIAFCWNLMSFVLVKIGKTKGNTIQAWTGPEGSRGLRLLEYLDSQHIKVVRLSALRTGRLYTPRNIAGTHFFGGAEEECWPLIPKFAGSNPAEAVGFIKGDKNPQHAFLRKGSKIIGPMSQICGM